MNEKQKKRFMQARDGCIHDPNIDHNTLKNVMIISLAHQSKGDVIRYNSVPMWRDAHKAIKHDWIFAV